MGVKIVANSPYKFLILAELASWSHSFPAREPGVLPVRTQTLGRAVCCSLPPWSLLSLSPALEAYWNQFQGHSVSQTSALHAEPYICVLCTREPMPFQGCFLPLVFTCCWVYYIKPVGVLFWNCKLLSPLRAPCKKSRGGFMFVARGVCWRTGLLQAGPRPCRPLLSVSLLKCPVSWCSSICQSPLYLMGKSGGKQCAGFHPVTASCRLASVPSVTTVWAIRKVSRNEA